MVRLSVLPVWRDLQSHFDPTGQFDIESRRECAGRIPTRVQFMTAKVKSLIKSFDTLSGPEQREAAAVILRRTVAWDSPPLTDDDLVSAAEELFLQLDAEEEANESSQSR